MLDKITDIYTEFENVLPGEEAQYKMAPSGRAIRQHSPGNQVLQNSAVIVLLFKENEELNVLLTQRATYDGPHSGQISFPGGKFDTELDRDLSDTVLRETREEVCLETKDYKIIGELSPLTIPISKNFVQPYLAYCSDISLASFDNFEVVDLYKVPVKTLFDPSLKKWKNEDGFKYPYYDYNGKVIWGATAMILSELSEIFMGLKQS